MDYLPQAERLLSGTLSALLSDSATSMTVSDPPSSSKLPTYLEIEPDDETNRETVRVTAVSGSTCTIERGVYNGGTGKEHQSNSAYKQKITSKHWDAVADAIQSGYLTEDPSYTITQVDTRTFRIAGVDRTDFYKAGRVVRFNGSDASIAIVSSSSYSASNTDVIVVAGTVPGTITSLEMMIGPAAGMSNITQSLADGWTPVGETWTYASATTITVAGVDVTSYIYAGVKIKLTQSTGGTKYFYVASSSFSTNTTVTIIGTDDYTLENEAISSPFYSIFEIAEGFPAWHNWTPTISVDGGTAPTYTDDFVNRYKVTGSQLYFYINWANVTGGTAGAGTNALVFTLPIAVSSTAQGLGNRTTLAVGQVSESGGTTSVVAVYVGATANEAKMRLYDISGNIVGNDQSSSSRWISASGFYEI